MSDLPKEIGRGMIHLAPDLEIEVINLDNGQRLVTPETMEKFLQWLLESDGQIIEGEPAPPSPSHKESRDE